MEISDSDITSDNILNNIEIKTYSHLDKKLLVKRIGNIKSKKCYIKIFKLIHGDNLSYTKNDNGIFFNLTVLSDTILSQIENIIHFYENIKNQNEQTLINKLNDKNNN